MKNVQTEEEQVLEAVLKAMEFVVHVRLIESYTAVIAKVQIPMLFYLEYSFLVLQCTMIIIFGSY